MSDNKVGKEPPGPLEPCLFSSIRMPRAGEEISTKVWRGKHLVKSVQF